MIIMCKEELNEIDEELDTENIEELSKEQLLDVVEYLTNIPKLDFEELMNTKEFKKGVKDVSNTCGQFVALSTVGIEPSSAIDIIINEANIKFNKEINTENCNTSIKSARLSEIKVEQNQI